MTTSTRSSSASGSSASPSPSRRRTRARLSPVIAFDDGPFQVPPAARATPSRPATGHSTNDNSPRQIPTTTAPTAAATATATATALAPPAAPTSPPLSGAQWSPTATATSMAHGSSFTPRDDDDLDDDDDVDYRSETSSETNSRDSSGPQTPKNVSMSYTNHRDLSTRLRRAINGCHGDASGGLTATTAASSSVVVGAAFDESVIGADVVLCVRGSRFHAHRFMLAASSAPFRAMLTGPMREATQREVEIQGVEPVVLERMLLFIYTGEVTVDLQTVVGLLIAAEMYELLGLREICKGFVRVHAHDVFRDPLMVQIPEKVLIEIIADDDLQIREITLMEALVMWGEARVTSSGRPMLEILSDVMEHVRFPTMSVSDLYGKVRPLVTDGVIRDALLTEALFHHLKWGTHAGKASQRMKPRAGAMALRKRKRVSFIQHVSFVTE